MLTLSKFGPETMVKSLAGTLTLLSLATLLVVAACGGDDSPTPANTPVPAVPTHTPAAPMPTDTPQPATVQPTPTLAPTLSPTQAPAIAQTMAPTATPEPSPTAPAPEFAWKEDGVNDLEESAAESLESIERTDLEAARVITRLPWLADEITLEERLALPALEDLTEEDPSLAQDIARLEWLSDEVTDDELRALTNIRDIAQEDTGVARQLIASPWLADGVTEEDQLTVFIVRGVAEEDADLAMSLLNSGEVADGISQAEFSTATGTRNFHLQAIHQDFPEVGETLRSYGWVADGTVGDEWSALALLLSVAREDASLSQTLAQAAWVADGITANDRRAINNILNLAEEDSELAQQLLELPWVLDGISPSEQRALVLCWLLAGNDAGQTQFLLSQPWFRDHLTDEELALVVALRTGCQWNPFYRELIERGHVRSEVFLRPSGEVKLFAVSRAPFEPSVGNVFQGLRTGIDAIEDFMGPPWVKSEVIVYLEPELTYLREVAGLNAGTHILIKPNPADPQFNDVLYHELAHFYFGYRNAPRWLAEGGADFLESYTLHFSENASMQSRYESARRSVYRRCFPERVSRIDGLLDAVVGVHPTDYLQSSLWPCTYPIGESFLLGVYDAFGQDVVEASLRDLYGKWRTTYLKPTEDDVYQTFLTETPAAKREEFRELYHCLHGGPASGYPPGAVSIPDAQRNILSEFYDAMSGPDWVNGDNWLTDSPGESWHGVMTDCQGNVSGLILQSNGLQGELPSQLEELESLRALYLSGNDLAGCIPGHLFDLPAHDFDTLGLQFCSQRTPATTTPQPTSLPTPTGSEAEDRAALIAFYNATDGANWANNDNWLTSTPMGEWHGINTDSKGRVVEIVLRENFLAGPIPPEVGTLANLRRLDLRNINYGCTRERGCEATSPTANQLTGPLPAELGELIRLEHLHLGINPLTGQIPAELANLANLKSLHLSVNSLSGELPAWLGSLSNLEFLHLAANDITGSIPVELASFPKLQFLHLGNNHLTGTIPDELGNLAELRQLYLQGNQLSGEIPSSLRNLTSLEALWLSNNKLKGTIPPWIGNFPELKELLLFNNELTGSIPGSLTLLENLNQLKFWGNGLTGCVPRGLQRIQDSDLDFLELPFCR